MTTLRLSTQSLYSQNLNNLLSRQSQIGRLQQQISSEVKLTQGKDDPVGMAAAHRLDHLQAALEQFGLNALRVDHHLRLTENAMGDTNDVLNKARELAIQANSGTLTPDDRKAIASEVLQLRKNLISIANRDDGNGRRLFAGNRDGVVPFTDTATGVIYHGDDGHNSVEVAPDVPIEDGNPGSQVFLRVRSGDGYARGAAAASNTGSGVLLNAQAIDGGTWSGDTLSVRFTTATNYEVVDGAGNPLVPAVVGTWANGTVVPPAAAGLGVEFNITGAPAAGDTFTIEKAPNQDIFKTLQNLADTLLAPGTGPVDNAKRVNAYNSVLADISSAQTHVMSIRTSVGARMADIEIASDNSDLQSLTLSESLVKLRNTNMPEAISQLSMQLVALEAAHKVTLQSQSMSLFSRL